MGLRVLVISENPLARSGMETLVQEIPGANLLGSGDPAATAALATELLPDVVLLDVGIGDPQDLELIGSLAAASPGLPIVALAAEVEGLGQALGLGALALLPASVDSRTLGTALTAAAAGLASVPRAELSRLLPSEDGAEPGPDLPQEELTPREFEVLQGMARGLTNREIAGRLLISEHTVKFHVASVLGKLQARSRAAAVARAARLGWILV